MRRLLFLLVLFGSSALLDATVWIQDQTTVPLLNPSFAEQQRKKLRLDNGLEVFLVSDPKATRSSAALAVRIGSWDDPDDIPGMAHFCEHMLFMGTKKYPDEGEYRQFIEQNNGTSNAFTANDHTCYGFDVAHAAFSEALDRFAQFFIEPLFHPSGVSRELHAIDQEFAKAKQQEGHRILHVYRDVAPEGHPLHRFTCGNSRTLAICSQERLREWYFHHYSSDLMHLVIYSSLPLSSIEELVVGTFSQIPLRDTAHETRAPTESIPETLRGKTLLIEPVKKSRTLNIFWEIPSSFSQMQEAKPATLAAALLSSDHPESLSAILKENHLAKEMDASIAHLFGKNRELLILSIDLTGEGLQEIDTVYQIIFDALRAYGSGPPPAALLEQIADTIRIEYQFEQLHSPFEQAMDWAVDMMREDLSTFPEKNSLIFTIEPQSVQGLFSHFTPDRGVFLLIAPHEEVGREPSHRETWMEIPYTLEEPSEARIAQWTASSGLGFSFPPPNPFLPENLALVANELHSAPESEPTLLVSDAWSDLFYLPDHYYRLPKVYQRWEIATPAIVRGDPFNELLIDFTVQALRYLLQPVTISAQHAGLEWELASTAKGISIEIFGYNDKANRLLETIVAAIKAPQLTPRQFHNIRESLEHHYENKEREPPYQQLLDLFRATTHRKYSLASEKKQALRLLDQHQFELFVDRLFHQMHCVGFLYGNIKEEEAYKARDILFTTLSPEVPFLQKEWQDDPILILSEREGPQLVEMPLAVSGHAALLAIQTHPHSWKRWAAWRILNNRISAPFFSTLRSRQQTGYVVASLPLPIRDHLFTLFLVQSHTHDARDLLARFELFLEEYLLDIRQDQEAHALFRESKETLLEELRTPPSSMATFGKQIGEWVFVYDRDFLRREKQIRALQELTFEEYVAELHATLGRENYRRVAFLGNGDEAPFLAFSYRKEKEPFDIRRTNTFD